MSDVYIQESAFIKALVQFINEAVTCYYEDAPEGAAFPYCTVSSLNTTPLEEGEHGCLALFYIDVWAGEQHGSETRALETACDRIVNRMQRAVISKTGEFAAHIGFENKRVEQETEFDIAHRRISMSARIFYY